MTTPEGFKTLRLRLRPFTPDDVERALAMDADYAVRRCINPIIDEARRRARYQMWVRREWPPRGAGWVVEWRTAPGLLGWVGVFPLDNSDELEIGYRYVRTAWGQGLAHEAAVPVRDWAFAGLSLDRLLAVTDPRNKASQRVLTKLGFARRGWGRHYGVALPVFVLAQPVRAMSRST